MRWDWSKKELGPSGHENVWGNYYKNEVKDNNNNDDDDRNNNNVWDIHDDDDVRKVDSILIIVDWFSIIIYFSLGNRHLMLVS